MLDPKSLSGRGTVTVLQDERSNLHLTDCFDFEYNVEVSLLTVISLTAAPVVDEPAPDVDLKFEFEFA